MERVRIVALGDSTTAGTPGFLSPLEAPPSGRGDPTSQYTWWLMQSHPEWEVLNRGVNGERSDQIAARFDRDVLAERPTGLVLIAGVNDVYQGRTVAQVVAQLRSMYDRALHAGIRLIAGTILPYDTATGEQNVRMREINAWIRRQSAGDPRIAVADTRAAVSLPGNRDRLSDTVDELHPSPAGYRAVAGALRPVIEEVLRSNTEPFAPGD